VVRRFLEIVSALTLIGGSLAAVLLLEDGQPGRVAAGIVLALLAPGVAFAYAVLPSRIGGPERIALGLAAGIALAIGATLALDISPWTLDATHWAIAMAGVSGILAVVAIAMRRGATVARAPRWRRPRVRDLAVMTLAGAIVAGALVIGLTPAGAPAGTPGHTALWIVPQGTNTVQVGVTGGNLAPTAYRVAVSVDGQPLGSPREWTVTPGQTHSESLDVPAPDGARVQATLTRADDPSEAIRTVFVTLPDG
jgi:hypothetical protein